MREINLKKTYKSVYPGDVRNQFFIGKNIVR